ncbi:cytochrome d ubiquinol oxidase subunit II [Microbispora sp. NPDC049125]|uniref:cytochrome d ubiquinol oxidase subunit II n=1 Tax=Microbispora sp. NPDC049125 TaxID=3154929 RepID=UPI003467403B
MEILWLGAFAVLLAGYFALEGFDIGLGVLLPVLGRSQAGRDRLVAAMAPFVLANEVWLVALAGVLFGVFPTLEGEVLSGLYPLVVALLLSWVLRDAGLWFRRRAGGRAWRVLWDGALWLGSAGLALTWGMALAGVALGLPAALGPAGVAAGVAVLLLLALHGWTFAAWRLPGDEVVRGAVRDGRALLLTACAAAVPALAVTAFAASSMLDRTAPDQTLTVLSVMVVPFAPILVGAQLWVWRIFRKGALPSFF